MPPGSQTLLHPQPPASSRIQVRAERVPRAVTCHVSQPTGKHILVPLTQTRSPTPPYVRLCPVRPVVMRAQGPAPWTRHPPQPRLPAPDHRPPPPCYATCPASMPCPPTDVACVPPKRGCSRYAAPSLYAPLAADLGVPAPAGFTPAGPHPGPSAPRHPAHLRGAPPRGAHAEAGAAGVTRTQRSLRRGRAG